MRRLVGAGAVVLGSLGVLACAAAIGLGVWAAARVNARVTRAAGTLDRGLSEADERLGRVEQRLAAIRGEVAEVRAEAARLAAENPELPRVRAAIERLLDRLIPATDRAAALADSLRAVAAGLRAAEDVATQLGADIQQPSRARAAADAIDRAAGVLNVPRARIDAAKSAAAGRLTRELIELAREAAAGSELLAQALADARREVASARGRVVEWRRQVVFWVRVAAVAHTLGWLWIGVGQSSLVGWGRRRFARPVPPLPPPPVPGRPP